MSKELRAQSEAHIEKFQELGSALPQLFGYQIIIHIIQKFSYRIYEINFF